MDLAISRSTLPAHLAGLALFAVAAVYGGWPWAVMAVVWVAALRGDGEDSWMLLQVGASGLFWLALFHWTGDRRLFFPFSMQVAATLAVQWHPAAGGVVVAGFAAIRLWQGASTHVLEVEMVVAVVVLGVALAFNRPLGNWGATAAAALLALAGLGV